MKSKFLNILLTLCYSEDETSYYQSYLKFFTVELKDRGTASTLEKFIFSPEANFGEKHPEMVSHILAGLLHPMIYVGHGIEFGHLGLVAEGLSVGYMWEVM